MELDHIRELHDQSENRSSIVSYHSIGSGTHLQHVNAKTVRHHKVGLKRKQEMLTESLIQANREVHEAKQTIARAYEPIFKDIFL